MTRNTAEDIPPVNVDDYDTLKVPSYDQGVAYPPNIICKDIKINELDKHFLWY